MCFQVDAIISSLTNDRNTLYSELTKYRTKIFVAIVFILLNSVIGKWCWWNLDFLYSELQYFFVVAVELFYWFRIGRKIGWNERYDKNESK